VATFTNAGGNTNGVVGTTSTHDANGVVGHNSDATPRNANKASGHGVFGGTLVPDGAGVFGVHAGVGIGSGGLGLIGVWGGSVNGVGVLGISAPPGAKGGDGVQGITNSEIRNGVYGRNDSTAKRNNDDAAGNGVFGYTRVPDGAGVMGVSGAGGIGVSGASTSHGVMGKGGFGVTGRGSIIGVWGIGDGSGWAGQFSGPVLVNGSAYFQREVSVGGGGNSGDVRVLDGAGRRVVLVDGANADLHVGANGNAGDVIVVDSSGRQTIRLHSDFAALVVGANGKKGDIQVLDGAGRVVFAMEGNTGLLTIGAAGNDGEIRVLDTNGIPRVRIIGSSGDISLSGADCAEEFEITPGIAAEPGDVLVIEEDERLRRCLEAYDRRVAGVMSGAGDLRPGIVLDRRGGERRAPIALAGKVVCKVDAGYGAIGVGDLLTTSPTPGHAMRAADPSRAFGAVLGKALRGLPGGRGLVPVLVGLQ